MKEKKRSAHLGLLHKISAIALLFSIPEMSDAQSWPGYQTGNFSGVHALQFQPADIANSPYLVDINLISISATLFENGLLPDYNIFKDLNGSIVADFNQLLQVNADELSVNYALMLPSAMYSINDRSAVALSFGARAMTLLETSEPDINNILTGNIGPELINTQYTNEYIHSGTLAWTEIGLSYGREIYRDDHNTFKAGATAKLIQGLAEMTFRFDQVRFEVEDDSTLAGVGMDVRYRYNSKADELIKGEKFRLSGDGGFAFDLGATYEYRESASDAPYKFKVGVALIDMGSIKFDAAEDRHMSATLSSVSVNSFRNIQSADELRDTLDKLLDTSDVSNPGSYTVPLPSRLSFQFDYHVYNDLYINVYPSILFNQLRLADSESRNTWNVAVTPRYENKTYGIYLPFQTGEDIPFNSGLSLRWKAFIVGSGNLISRWFYKENTVIGVVYFIAKIPILKKEYR